MAAPRRDQPVLLAARPSAAVHRTDRRRRGRSRPGRRDRAGGAGRAARTPPDRAGGRRRTAAQAPDGRRPVLPPRPVAAGDRRPPGRASRNGQVAPPLRAPQPARPARRRPTVRGRLRGRRRTWPGRTAVRDRDSPGRLPGRTPPNLRSSPAGARPPARPYDHLGRCARCRAEVQGLALASLALQRLAEDAGPVTESASPVSMPPTITPDPSWLSVRRRATSARGPLFRWRGHLAGLIVGAGLAVAIIAPLPATRRDKPPLRLGPRTSLPGSPQPRRSDGRERMAVGQPAHQKGVAQR